MLRKILIAAALLFVPSLVMAQVKADHHPRELVLEDCANTASGTTVTADGCNVITFTGVTQIDTINTCNAAKKGRELSVICGSAVPFGDGAGNLLLNGAFTCAADGTLSLICGGTNWAEVSRGVTAVGADGFGTIGSAVADSADDTLTITDSATIDFTTTDAPENLTADFLPAGIDGPTWGDNTSSTWVFAVGATDPTWAFDTDLLTITNMATLTASATDADFDALTSTTTTTDPSATPGINLRDSDMGGTPDVNMQIQGNCPTGTTAGGDEDCDLDFSVQVAGTLTNIVRIDTPDADVGRWHIVPLATAPTSCAIGDFYVDTSGASCACSAANTWLNMHATGTCV